MEDLSKVVRPKGKRIKKERANKMKMTIGKKIASIIVVMAVLIGISGIVGVISIGKVGKNADVIMNEAKIVDSIQEARVSFQQLLMPPNDYLITGGEEEKEKFEKLVKLTKDNLTKCDKLLQVACPRLMYQLL